MSVPILFALLAAASNATATVLQRIGVEQASKGGVSSRALIAGVLHRPVWFVGLALTTTSFLLQAVAIAWSNLSTVQPVMVTEIVFLVAILGVWFRRRVGWREWVGTCGTALGLGLFLALSHSRGGNARPTSTDWLLLLVAASGAVVVFTLAGRRGPAMWRAASYGLAAGVTFALTAAFVKSTADEWSRGIGVVFTHPEVYGVAASGLIGLVVAQHALEAGPIAASQSALLIVNPISSIVMGVWLFDDHVDATGPRLGLEVASLALMSIALVVLAQSPLISSAHANAQLSSTTRFHPKEAAT